MWPLVMYVHSLFLHHPWSLIECTFDVAFLSRFYSILSVLEWFGDLMDDETSEAPVVQDYDRQYFAKDALQEED